MLDLCRSKPGDGVMGRRIAGYSLLMAMLYIGAALLPAPTPAHIARKRVVRSVVPPPCAIFHVVKNKRGKVIKRWWKDGNGNRMTMYSANMAGHFIGQDIGADKPFYGWDLYNGLYYIEPGDTSHSGGVTITGYPSTASFDGSSYTPATFNVVIDDPNDVLSTGAPLIIEYEWSEGGVIVDHSFTYTAAIAPYAPPPTAHISASPNPASGVTGTSTVTWTTSDADTAVVSGPGLSSTALNGSQGVVLASSPSTYSISATNADGTATDSVDVTVADPTCSIGASPNPVTV